MRNVKVLFFSADPSLGRPGGVPLELANEMREIQEHVKRARYGHRLQLEAHGAARADDLLDFLEHTDASVVHFSGHGESRGIVLVGRDGCSPHPVSAPALRRVFREYHGTVRLVVLSACSSHQEAQAVADVVGCAIGTTSAISDDAATTFNSWFYRSIGNGHSVQRSFEIACMRLEVDRVPEQEYPKIFHRKGVDPADLVLVKTVRLVPRRVVAATVACAVVTKVVVCQPPVPPEPTVSDLACSAESTTDVRTLSGSRGAASATPAEPAGPAGDVAIAKAFYRNRNYADAAEAFEQAATDGNGEAMGCLGYMYMYGRGMKPQPVTGFELVRKAARDKRDPHAMYALANAYLAGVGTVAREHLARTWFENAAELGYAEAMRSLGELHRLKMNDSSHHQALTWYHEAVKAGSADAMVDIGKMYEFGGGVRRDPATALQWYRSAAAAGSLQGLWAIGYSYQNGIGVERDFRKAMSWYRRAAKAGSAEAMNSIGVLYDNGLGVRTNHAQANRWYRRAAQAGSDHARGNLGAFGKD
jgi:TPR repeat protein